MKWSREDSKVPGDWITLGFPNGVQALLDLRPPADEEGEEHPDETNGGPGAAPRLELPAALARALLAWQMVGIHLFLSGRRPSVSEAVFQARSVVLAMALELKDENITQMALALHTSRRAVREQLKKAGLYDRARMEDDEDETTPELLEEVRTDGGR